LYYVIEVLNCAFNLGFRFEFQMESGKCGFLEVSEPCGSPQPVTETGTPDSPYIIVALVLKLSTRKSLPLLYHYFSILVEQMCSHLLSKISYLWY
jgi:hypothetical protein